MVKDRQWQQHKNRLAMDKKVLDPAGALSLALPVFELHLKCWRERSTGFAVVISLLTKHDC